MARYVVLAMSFASATNINEVKLKGVSFDSDGTTIVFQRGTPLQLRIFTDTIQTNLRESYSRELFKGKFSLFPSVSLALSQQGTRSTQRRDRHPVAEEDDDVARHAAVAIATLKARLDALARVFRPVRRVELCLVAEWNFGTASGVGTAPRAVVCIAL